MWKTELPTRTKLKNLVLVNSAVWALTGTIYIWSCSNNRARQRITDSWSSRTPKRDTSNSQTLWIPCLSGRLLCGSNAALAPLLKALLVRCCSWKTSLPADIFSSKGGYPPWSPETNHQYPVECKQVVKTLLMIHSIHQNPINLDILNVFCIFFQWNCLLKLFDLQSIFLVTVCHLISFWNLLSEILFGLQSHISLMLGWKRENCGKWFQENTFEMLHGEIMLLSSHVSPPSFRVITRYFNSTISIRWWGIVFMGWFSWTSDEGYMFSSWSEETLFCWRWFLFSCLLTHRVQLFFSSSCGFSACPSKHTLRQGGTTRTQGKGHW